MKRLTLIFYEPSEKMPDDGQEVILLLKNDWSVMAEYNLRKLQPSFFQIANFGTIGSDKAEISVVKCWAATPSGADILYGSRVL